MNATNNRQPTTNDETQSRFLSVWSKVASCKLLVVGHERKRCAAPAFTLIELMVVLAIVVLISLIILVSASRFNSAILLRSLAYEVGLSIREAQLYGVAVHATPGEIPGQCSVGVNTAFCASYGVHFASASPTQYVIFTDLNNNGVDDDAAPVADTFTTQYGFTISNFCGVTQGVATACEKSCVSAQMPVGISCGSSLTPISSLDVTFRRPDPDAIITVNSDPAAQYDSAIIIVGSPGGSTRSVSVSLTGQITVTGTGS